VEALGDKVVVLHTGRQRSLSLASLELSEMRYVDAESCIARFVQLVRRLPRSARRLWDTALQRRFDIGIQAESNGETFRTLIGTATLRRVVELGGEIAITVYAPPPRRKGRALSSARSR
jgi:hypothetical protein